MKYFKKKLSAGFLSLFYGRSIRFLASGLVGLFLPIFLLTKLDYNIKSVFVYFLVGHLLYAFTLPFGVQFLNKVGLKRSLMISAVLDSLLYVCYFFIDTNPSLFLILSVVVLTFDRLFFWVPFHTDFAKFTNAADRGKEVGLMWVSKSFLGVVMPLISGILIAKFSFNFVFALAIIIFLIPFIFYLKLPHTHEKYVWGIGETFKNFFAKKNRKLVWANMANGAENVVGVTIWPIFIWQLFNGDFTKVGLISSLMVFVTIILQVAVGKYTDLFDKRKMIRWGSCFYAIGWLAKIFVLTTFQIFIVGTYHSFTQIFKDTPFDTLNYEMMADHGHFVDEYTVLKEMAIQIGKALMLIFAVLIAFEFGLNWTFVLAALASLFINVL